MCFFMAAPTLVPTTIDTASVAVTFALAANSAPKDSDIGSLKTTVATEAGVSEDDIQGFTVTFTNSSSTSDRRLSLRPWQIRRLASYTWSVSFEVVVSLTSAGFSDSSSFVTAVSNGLADIDTQASDDLGMVFVLSSPVTTTLATRSPSSVPSPSPLFMASKIPTVELIVAPTSSDSRGEGGSVSAASVPIIAGVAAGGLIILIITIVACWRTFRSKGNDSANDDIIRNDNQFCDDNAVLKNVRRTILYSFIFFSPFVFVNSSIIFF